MNEQTRNHLKTAAAVLQRCWCIGFILLIIWLAATQLMYKPIYNLHGSMFGLKSHEMDLIFYCAMGIFKLGVLILFFVPWLAIRMVLMKSQPSES